MKPPLKGRITSKFGSRTHPITKEIKFHNGIDIAAPVGTKVLAPDSGKIIKCWDHPKGGICLAMLSNSGIRYGFAHLSMRLVKEGDKVTEGQLIAKSGNSGASTGPHLHFTVQINGEWKDPDLYFDFI